MDEISDTNDNKNHKVSFIELIDSSEKTTKTMDSDSSWIEFQGNNNNLNEKTVLRNLNCGAGSVGGRTTENCANFLTTITTTVATAPPTAATETTTITTTSDVDLTLGPILQQQNQQKILTNGSEYYDSTAMTMRSPPQKSLANDDDHNGVNYLSPYEMDNNGIKTSPDDTDADEPSENNSTDNLSFNSEDGNIGLIDDIVLLPNNLISEDELSTNSDDCVYAYRGADFDPIPANPEDENDFLEMDFEPDPASEIEQDNNLLLNNGLNVINSFEHAAASAINAIDAMDFGLGIKNGAIEKSLYGDSIALNGRNDFSGSPTNNLLNQRIDNVSTADKCNIDKSHCMEEFQRKINENGAVPSTSNCIGDGCGNGLLNGATAVAQPSYYDNIVVSLSTKKYTGTIPKTSRTTNGARTIRHKMAAKDSANKTGNSDAELKCRECAEKCLQQSSSSMRNEQREANECKRCQALQTFSCMRNGFDVNTSLDIGSSSTSAQQPIPKNGLNKRSMSFPVVNRHENGYTESTDNIEGTSYPPSRFYGSSDPNHYDEQNGHRLDPFGFYETHETDSSRIPENSVSIYSICFTEDIIVDALVSNRWPISWLSLLNYFSNCFSLLLFFVSLG